MKTKIIYISGSEVFDMADIRAAFDEVRATLGLANDTVLFGVPVDKESALDVPVNDTDDAIAPVADLVDDTPDEDVTPAPVKKSKRASRRDAAAPVATENAPVIDVATPIEEPTADSAETAPVIPILSVLGGGAVAAATAPAPADADEYVTPAPAIAEDAAPIIDIEQVEITVSDDVTEIIPDQDSTPMVAIETVTVASASDDNAPNDAAPVDSDDIDEIVGDNTPAVPVEKTLEQLLESMTPLREDIVEEDVTANAPAPQVDDTPIDADPMPSFDDDSDATLAQLADDFINSQDKLPTPTSTGRGRIGKLKTIIPFKRKQEDTGLMSDLFGWAGVAANDDEVSLPSFFANAQGRK